MQLHKYCAALLCSVMLAPNCPASEPPKLDKAEALRIAMDLAKEQQWKVTSVWKDMPRFNETSREWRVFINIERGGGPMIVTISDETKKVRFTHGE